MDPSKPKPGDGPDGSPAADAAAVPEWAQNPQRLVLPEDQVRKIQELVDNPPGPRERLVAAFRASRASQPNETSLAERLDLPEHERQVSAESLRQLDEGIAAVQEGRVRQAAHDELGPADDE